MKTFQDVLKWLSDDESQCDLDFLEFKKTQPDS